MIKSPSSSQTREMVNEALFPYLDGGRGQWGFNVGTKTKKSFLDTVMERIDALSCLAILEGFDMSCLPELGVSR